MMNWVLYHKVGTAHFMPLLWKLGAENKENHEHLVLRLTVLYLKRLFKYVHFVSASFVVYYMPVKNVEIKCESAAILNLSIRKLGNLSVSKMRQICTQKQRR